MDALGSCVVVGGGVWAGVLESRLGAWRGLPRSWSCRSLREKGRDRMLSERGNADSMSSPSEKGNADNMSSPSAVPRWPVRAGSGGGVCVLVFWSVCMCKMSRVQF